MRVKFGQASYGERESGHRLLGASDSSASVADEIVHQMDIQGSPPPDFDWRPFWSGFATEQYYVLARTARDLEAPRAGMVRSRALFLRLEDVGNLESLTPAIQFLTEHFDDPAPYDDVILNSGGELGTPAPDLVAALLEGKFPVVWALDMPIESALTNLWHNLWPAARRALSFRLAFSPQDDLAANSPLFVTTPSSLAARWIGYRTVSDSTESKDIVVAMLVGDEAGATISALMREIGTERMTLANVRQLEFLAEALKPSATLDEMLAALRMLGHLAPGLSQAKPAKDQLLAATCASLSKATAPQIRMARNLRLDDYAEGQSFWKAVERWAASSLWDQSPSESARILTEANASDGPIEEWRGAINSGAADYLLSRRPGIGAALWEVLRDSPKLLDTLYAKAPQTTVFEDVLLGSAPKRLGQAVEQLLASSVRLKLHRLHAAICASTLAPKVAVRRHLKDAVATEQSIALAAARAKPQELVELAVEGDNAFLFSLAVDRVVENVDLLSKLEVSSEGWRRLWRQSIERNGEAWRGPADPTRSFYGILDGLLDVTFQDLPLLAALSATPLANVLHYPRREALWSKLPPNTRINLVQATAVAWAEELAGGSRVERPEQPIFEIVVLEANLSPLLHRLESSPLGGCALFQLVDGLDEHRFGGWFDRALRATSSFDLESAEAVGRLIALRFWKAKARWLADLVLGGRTDLRPAIPFVADQLRWITRLELNLPGDSKRHARWRVLEEIGAELYPIGPGDRDLWGRAGGRESDIPRARNGGEGWRIVVKEMENGGGQMKVKALLEAMASDFEFNPVLQRLRDESFK
jgi:hypothetical protein